MTKLLGWLLLLGAGVLVLPLAAAVLDGQGTENWIIPADLVAMALIGTLVGAGLPGFLAGTKVRRVALGALCGVGAAVAGVLLFFLLLSGFEGA